MIMNHHWKNRDRLFTLLAIIMALTITGCKKGNSPTEPAVDPSLTGVWYSNQYSVGFEVFNDGSSKTLVVDTAGKIQYNPPGGEINSSLVLTITKAKAGNLTSILVYKQPGIDTTMTVPGTYTLSNDRNTLSVIIPDPMSSLQQITIVFIRSVIGGIVQPKT